MLLRVIRVINYWQPLGPIVDMELYQLRVWVLKVSPHVLMVEDYIDG